MGQTNRNTRHINLSTSGCNFLLTVKVLGNIKEPTCGRGTHVSDALRKELLRYASRGPSISAATQGSQGSLNLKSRISHEEALSFCVDGLSMRLSLLIIGRLLHHIIRILPKLLGSVFCRPFAFMTR